MLACYRIVQSSSVQIIFGLLVFCCKSRFLVPWQRIHEYSLNRCCSGLVLFLFSRSIVSMLSLSCTYLHMSILGFAGAHSGTEGHDSVVFVLRHSCQVSSASELSRTFQGSPQMCPKVSNTPMLHVFGVSQMTPSFLPESADADLELSNADVPKYIFSKQH